MPDQSEPGSPAADATEANSSSDANPHKPDISESAANRNPPADSSNLSENTVKRPTEFGGQKGLEPTRYGDWEKNGRCTDF